jgi:hypothetical protein
MATAQATSALAEVGRCQWREPGGMAAACAIARFLDDIGISVCAEAAPTATFLPGMEIRRGAICVDPATPAWPGDLLHEAGHIAVLEAAQRVDCGPLDATPADEMTAIAWSVAAAHACGVPLTVLFHPEGYAGGAEALIACFTGEGTVGVPLLACWGMSAEPRRAAALGRAPFPAMARWLR